MHWLSAKPTDIADHIHAVSAEGAALAAVARKRRAIETILLARAASGARRSLGFVASAGMRTAAIWATPAACQCLPPGEI